MARESLRLALEGHLKELTPEWPTAWENVRFDREAVDGQSWQKSDIMIAETRAVGVGPNSAEEWKGIYQVTLFTPVGDGPGPAEARARLLRGDLAVGVPGHFRRGQDLTSGGVTATILQPIDGSVFEDDAKWWGFPVKIPFIAYVFPT